MDDDKKTFKNAMEDVFSLDQHDSTKKKKNVIKHSVEQDIMPICLETFPGRIVRREGKQRDIPFDWLKQCLKKRHWTTLDCHEHKMHEVEIVLARKCYDMKQQGHKYLLVIHGKSQVSQYSIKDAICLWAEDSSEVLAYGPVPSYLGGEGATMVLMRFL